MKFRYMLIILSLGLFVILTSCKKDPPVQQAPIVRGKVQFSINNNYSLKQVYSAIKPVAGNMDYELDNFYYKKVIPDTMGHYYWLLFKSQPYLYSFDIFRYTGEDFTRFRDMDFKNLDDASYHIWDSIVQKEALTEMPDDGGQALRRGMLTVPEWQESQWISKLRALPEIESADFVFRLNNFE